MTYFVYIATNKSNGVFYIGVTNNLERRGYEHKNKLNFNSFTAKYNVNKIVYYEQTDDVRVAIEREKFLKKARRIYKLNLINGLNPKWDDLLAFRS